MAAITDFPEPDAMTREQVLRARGLVETSTGSGVEASPAPATNDVAQMHHGEGDDQEEPSGNGANAPRPEIRQCLSHLGLVETSTGSGVEASPAPATNDVAQMHHGEGDDQEEPSGNGANAPLDDGPTRACQGCGASIDGPPTKRWCSSACRKRHQRQAADVLGVSHSTVNRDVDQMGQRASADEQKGNGSGPNVPPDDEDGLSPEAPTSSAPCAVPPPSSPRAGVPSWPRGRSPFPGCPVPEPEPGSEDLPEHLGYLATQVDEAGAGLDPLAHAVDRLVEACTEAVGPPVIDPETGHATWHCNVTDIMGDVFNREPLRGKAVPRAEREAWLANRVGPMPGTNIPDD